MNNEKFKAALELAYDAGRNHDKRTEEINKIIDDGTKNSYKRSIKTNQEWLKRNEKHFNSDKSVKKTGASMIKEIKRATERYNDFAKAISILENKIEVK